MASLPADQKVVAANKTIDPQVDTIWQMALASFSANNESIVLPLEYGKLLSPETIEELKARLSRHLGCQTFVISDPAASAFRIFGLSAAAVEVFAQLGPNKLSLAGTPFESIVNATEEKFGKKVISNDRGMKQPAGDDKHAKIPRPPNAFILYRQAHHPIIKAENPGFHNNDISKVLGKQWKEESPAVRQMFKAKALERKAEHMKMYPDYQYAPRKPGQKKRRASRKDMEAGDEKEQYESLRFIDQEGDFYMESESGSAVGDDDMDIIGTHVDEGVRRFHIDGDDNIGIVLPAADNVNLTKMVEAHNKRADQDFGTCHYDPAKNGQASQSIPPHVENDSDFFEALIDWDAIAEDFKIIQEASGEDLAGLREIESGNPYLSLSDEDQRALFEAELERTLKFFD